MPAFPDDYLYYVLEQLDEVGEVNVRRMFGGYGLYLDGAFFAIISRENVLYFKVDASTRADYEALGMSQFTPLHYYEVPVEVLEDRVQLAIWARKAYDVALRQAAVKTPKRRSSRQRRGL
jgi:DNA transformation protein and related proteins